MRGILLAPPPGPGETVTLRLRLAAGEVVVVADPYDPVVEGAERIVVSRAADKAEDLGALLDLLSPGAAAALVRLDSAAMETAGSIWFAARMIRVVKSWSGVYGPDGLPVPLTPDAWQLACFTVPGFAIAFVNSWLAPRTVEIAAGNG